MVTSSRAAFPAADSWPLPETVAVTWGVLIPVTEICPSPRRSSAVSHVSLPAAAWQAQLICRSRRLPFSIPADEAHLPAFDRNATAITYDRWYGQRLLDRLGVPAAYPLGFGLSYTTFDFNDAAAEQDGPEVLRVSTTVRNTGDRDGWHVVQVYGVRLDGDRAGERRGSRLVRGPRPAGNRGHAGLIKRPGSVGRPTAHSAGGRAEGWRAPWVPPLLEHT